MAWLLHRLERALPQPVLRGKAGEQVGAELGERGPWVVAGGVLGTQARVRWLPCVPGVAVVQKEEGACSGNPAHPACPFAQLTHSLRHCGHRTEKGWPGPACQEVTVGRGSASMVGSGEDVGCRGGAFQEHQGRLPSGGGLQAET